MRVPLFEPEFGTQEEGAVLRVLRSGWVTMGPEVEAFEREFADCVGRSHAIAVSSCTAALHLVNLALDLGPGDEVIVPSLTFAATANAVHYTGATPVFADVSGPDDLCLDPADVECRITPRTRAVIAMHYAGFPCDMDALSDVCERHGIILLEDACHGLGGRIGNRAMGGVGMAACFSFFSNKMITTAEGGMVVTDDADLALRMRRLRSHGQTATAIDRERGAIGYDIREVGYNFRLDDLRAALGRAQLERLAEILKRRRALVVAYRTRFAELPNLRVPSFGKRGVPANYLMPVVVEEVDRDALRKALNEDGVQTSVHYPPVHLFTHYAKEANVALPVTETVARKVLTLPLYPAMRMDQVDYVCERLAARIAGAGAN